MLKVRSSEIPQALLCLRTEPTQLQGALSAAWDVVIARAMYTMAGSGWDALPAECKLLIFEQLSNRELARAARTCREFAAHIRGLRASLTSIVLPRGAHEVLRVIAG